MQRGELEAAWMVSDEVMRSRPPGPCWHLPRHQQHIWDGSPLTGRRVLIRCYHGLGDTIQFIRYAPLVKAVATEVVVWAQPALIPLLQTASGVDRLEPLHDGTPDVDYDVDVEIMELPYIFRSTWATLPSTTPYLHAPRALLPDDDRLKIGVVCKAGDWDTARSIPADLLASIGEIGELDVQLLHPNRDGPSPVGIRVARGTDTIEGTASLMRALDLVISVDSMPAHLAGALGVRAWTLLRHEPDWRWFSGRDDSPWYPSMRLFRETRAGDWAPVVDRVAGELRRLVESRR
jgi:hypothetical protein